MPKLPNKDVRFIDKVFRMEGGYVLNFTDRTMAEFFDENLGVDIEDPRYSLKGTSKAKRLRSFIEIENGHTVATLLRHLWEYKLEALEDNTAFALVGIFREDKNPLDDQSKLFELIDRLQSTLNVAYLLPLTII